MKKIFLLSLFSATAALAQPTVMDHREQTTGDALRYAQDNLNGTARFRAMSGAFGALGGDLSSINVNPAGSAVFNNSQAGVTLTSYNTKNSSSYFGTTASDKDNTFDLNQVGGVFVFYNDNPESRWRKFTFTANYENTNNFDNSVFFAGTNPTTSIGSFFTGFANQGNGIPLDLLQTQSGESIYDLYTYLFDQLGYGAQQAFLGYNAFVINPDADNLDNYVSNIPGGGNYYHEYEIRSRGYNSKLSFNFATQFGDRLHFGANLNAHFSDHWQFASLYEDNANNPDAGVQALRFNNELRTFGNGFSFQLGAIGKITESFRAGVSYESPTWMRLRERLLQSIATTRTEDAASLTSVIDPGFINEYETYSLRTPGKWTGSLAYVFGQHGLISIDYAIEDYGNTKYTSDYRFQADRDRINALNNTMSNQMSLAGELRIGAEYRIKNLSFRGGYRNEQSPYKDGDQMGDLNGFSGGLGYNFGRYKVDLAYNYWQRDYQQQFFASGLTSSGSVTTKNNNISLTLLCDL